MAGLTVSVQASGGVVTHAAVKDDCSIELAIEESPLFDGLSEHVFGRRDPDDVMLGRLHNVSDLLALRMAIAQGRIALGACSTFAHANVTSGEKPVGYSRFINRVARWQTAVQTPFIERLNMVPAHAIRLWDRLHDDSYALIGRNWAYVGWIYYMLFTEFRKNEAVLIGSDSIIKKTVLNGNKSAKRIFDSIAR